jgi:hypothetical protein
LNNLCKIEKNLFDEFDRNTNPKIVFIVASPRTGSTPLYEAVVKSTSFPYISNLTNTFYPNHPIIGLAIQHGIKATFNLKSNFGKTDDIFCVSEASGPFSNWFGGGHPSQVVSKSVIENKETHFKKTVNSIYNLYGLPLVVKNPWNCFRITDLSRVLPEAKFIWLKRDIADASKSDLEARYITKDDPNEWNSATPSNFKELLKKPHTQQVVENQYEFNIAIKNQLKLLSNDSWTEVFYEDFIKDPTNIMADVCSFLKCSTNPNNDLLDKIKTKDADLSIKDIEDIDSYIHDNSKRFNFLRPKSHL